MNIAVCDDEKEDREELCKDLKEVWDDAQIGAFENGTELFRKIQQGYYFDLIFMDIIMEQGDGIKIGKNTQIFSRD